MSFKQVENKRDPHQKAFAYDRKEDALIGPYLKMREDKWFNQAHMLKSHCESHHTKLYKSKIDALLEEDENVLNDMGATYDDTVKKLVYNACLNVNKLYAAKTRERIADVKVQENLVSEVRRLYNGGANFHPYL